MQRRNKSYWRRYEERDSERQKMRDRDIRKLIDLRCDSEKE